MSTTSSLQLDKGAESVTHVELSLITVDTDIQPRDVLSQDDVDRYAEHLDELPPVVVFFDGKTRWLSSGFHRYAAHEMRGKTLIACEVRDGSREDAYLFARGANAEHEKSGRPLTPKEKRRVIGEVLRVVPEWSDSRIAEHVGSSHPTVGKVRAEVVNFTTSQEEAERLDPPVRIGKDGKKQPAKKPGKKKAPPAEAEPEERRELVEKVKSGKEKSVHEAVKTRGEKAADSPRRRSTAKRTAQEAEQLARDVARLSDQGMGPTAIARELDAELGDVFRFRREQGYRSRSTSFEKFLVDLHAFETVVSAYTIDDSWVDLEPEELDRAIGKITKLRTSALKLVKAIKAVKERANGNEVP